MGVTLVCFLIFNVAGGDPAYQLAGKNATVEQIQSLRLELGLDRSFIHQYFDFLKQTLSFEWGHSWQTQEKISAMIFRGVGPSLSLTLPSFFLGILISLGLALYTTYNKDLWQDRWITFICLALMSVSFLVYIIAFQYFFAFRLNLFPVNGWEPGWTERWQYLFLPWLISICVSLGPNILIFRTVLIDESTQDYVTTARAKGLSYKILYLKHILKNALIPVSTVVLSQLPFLFTGSLLLEAFFGIPGLGGLLIQGIYNADLPVIKAMTVMGSLLYLFFNLLTDLVHVVVDPRLRFK